MLTAGNQSLASCLGESLSNRVTTGGIIGRPRPFNVSSSINDPMHMGAEFKWEMQPLKYAHASCVPPLLRWAVRQIGHRCSRCQFWQAILLSAEYRICQGCSSHPANCDSMLRTNDRCSSLYISQSRRCGGHSAGSIPSHSQSSTASLTAKDIPRSISTKSPTLTILSGRVRATKNQVQRCFSHSSGVVIVHQVCEGHVVPTLPLVTWRIGGHTSQTFSSRLELSSTECAHNVINEFL